MTAPHPGVQRRVRRAARFGAPALRRVLAAAVLLGCAAATASPRSDAKLAELKACLDTSLGGMLSSGDRAGLMGEAAFGECESLVDDLVAIDMAEVEAGRNAGFGDADAGSRAYLLERYRALVRSYAAAFRAQGGPTALSPPGTAPPGTGR
ncbi:hypothetical protein Q8W71_02715 [Methylobacterium sp. NEAU 140]|uniref:hypothetical protein n=1 Tax=Methylobacterium sp. NEAU 140 TaxID=3064945 RepID=UPI00273772AA|nr:hypothetical protein [Methylobacterium sp. NEAU 140]MDP4021523.1 hypothetical protein [Methylobacterium sp. NEAU 140]